MSTFDDNAFIDADELASLPDDLWDCLIDDNDGGGSMASSSVATSTAPDNDNSVISSAAELEVKLVSIEQGQSIPTDELIGELKNADHADLDAILANEMTQMSIAEKSKNIEKIHGVEDPEVVEDPQMMEEKLQQLDKCVSEITDKSIRDAYDRAYYISPEYVMDPKLRLVILRCENWDPICAARRLLNYYDLKLELFGKVNIIKNVGLCLVLSCHAVLQFFQSFETKTKKEGIF